jgi:hypothetical protein
MQRILSSTKRVVLSTKRLNHEAGKLFQAQQLFSSVTKDDKQKDDKQIPTPSISTSLLPPDMTFKSIATVGISSFVAVR